MRSYYRITLGKGGQFAEEAWKGGYLGVGFLGDTDLTGKLSENLRDFNSQFVPIYLAKHPLKTRIGAGLACGQLWNVTKGLQKGDIVLSPNGQSAYMVGEVMGDYEYHPEGNLPHRRPVNWFPGTVTRESMSTALKNSSGGITTVINLSRYSSEIEALIQGKEPATVRVEGESVEDPSAFALEKHLEEFLENNWRHTELGKEYDIFEEDGERVGRQYPTDTGPIDILAISKDKKELLVVELKRGRVSDVVVGQIQRYMGYVKDELAEEGQVVKGVIIGFEDDVRVHRALSVAQNIVFYTYKIQFSLEKRNQNP